MALNAAIIQQNSGNTGTVNANTITATLPNPATAGKLLVVVFARDKNAGSITIPAAWTVVRSNPTGPDVSAALAFKTATAGENVSVAVTFGGVERCDYWIAEVDVDSPVLDTSNAAYDASAVPLKSSTVTAPATTAQAYALGVCCIDTSSNFAASGWTWAAPLTLVDVLYGGLPATPSPPFGMPGIAIGHGVVASGTSVVGTFAWPSGTDDQTWIAVATFRSTAPTGPPPPVGTAAHVKGGAQTSTGFKATAKFSGLTASSSQVRLRASTTSDLLTVPVYSSWVTIDADSYATCQVTGLTADTQYYYGWETVNAGDLISTGRGAIETFPTVLTSLKICFASCYDLPAADHAIFTTVKNKQPLMVVHLGDFRYIDQNVTTQATYRTAFETETAKPNQAALYASTGLYAMHSDHDSMGDGAYGIGQNWTSAQPIVMRQIFPHPPLGDTTPTAARDYIVEIVPDLVYLFVMDTRRDATNPAATKTANDKKIGDAQMTRLQNFFTAHPLAIKFVGCIEPWDAVATSSTAEDHWGRYSDQRQVIANFITNNNIRNVIMLAGDMHAVAADDGRNSTSYGSLPVFQAAPFNRGGSQKGGPYLYGPSPTSNPVVNQAGEVTVTQMAGSTVNVSFRAFNTADTALLTVLSMDFDTGGTPVELSASIAGTGSVAPGAKVERKLASTLTGTGSVVPSARVARSLAASVTGVGSLAASPRVSKRLAAALAGSGTLAPTLRVSRSLSAVLIGSGTLAPALRVQRLLSGSVGGAGSLAEAILVRRALAASVLVTGQLAASVKVSRRLSAALTGSGSLAVTSRVARLLSASLTGRGLIEAIPAGVTRPVYLAAQILASGDVDAELEIRRLLASKITGVSDIAARLRIARYLGATVPGVGGLAANVRVSRGLSAQLAGVGSLVSTVQIARLLSPRIQGVGSLVATPRVTRRLAASIVGRGLVEAVPAGTVVPVRLAAQIIAFGDVDAALEIRRLLSAKLAGVGAFTAMPRVQRRIAGTVGGSSALEAEIEVSRLLAAAVSATGRLVPDVEAVRLLAAVLYSQGLIDGDLSTAAVVVPAYRPGNIGGRVSTVPEMIASLSEEDIIDAVLGEDELE